MQKLNMFGVRRIVVLPLFPQYSGTTTGSILSTIKDQMQAWPDAPHLTIIRDYHDHPAYIGAIGDQIRNHTHEKSHLLLSFHGIPRSYVEKGDPYESQCLKSAILFSQNLGLKPEEWSLAFQSRFGPQEWLTPYTDEELVRLGEKNLSCLRVVCPGFAVDCLETLDEIANEGAEKFQKAGGGVYEYIPALNDQVNHVSALSEILISHIKKEHN
jgi:ferrochelatase